jgi:hypothetical protein
MARLNVVLSIFKSVSSPLFLNIFCPYTRQTADKQAPGLRQRQRINAQLTWGLLINSPSFFLILSRAERASFLTDLLHLPLYEAKNVP